jgi:hypothetical protein
MIPINQRDPLKEGGKGGAYKANIEDVQVPPGGVVGKINNEKIVMRDKRQTWTDINAVDATSAEEMNKIASEEELSEETNEEEKIGNN